MAEVRKVDFHLHRLLEGDTHEDEAPGGEAWPGSQSQSDHINLVGAHVVTASAVFHRVEVDLVSQLGLDTALEAALRAQPSPDRMDWADETLNPPGPESASAVRSVAEVGIPIQVLVACRAADAGKSGVIALPGPEDIHGELLVQAFDRAVDFVRTIQSGYHAITRRPVTLLTNELLPPFVPYLVRSSAQIHDGEVVPVDLFAVHTSIGYLMEEPEVSAEQLDALFAALERSEVLMTYLDLHRQGSAALHLYGNTREAVVMMAAAAESLLDVVLGLLLWEEGFTPEQASLEWADGLMTRVKRNYSGRLGGRWDVNSKSPVGEWSRSVAGVRHRVVHAGYLPTRSEAERAIVAVEELLSFIGDRLTYGSNLRTYPRSASQVLGPEGLRRRQRLPDWLRALQEDPSEPVWHETFGRWYSTFTRILGDSTTPRKPRETDASVFAVVEFTGKGRQTTWVMADNASRQAAEAHVDLAPSLGDPVQRALGMAGDSGHRLGTRLSIGIHPEGVLVARRLGPWVEDYHLLPLNGVMVDASDFDCAWPV